MTTAEAFPLRKPLGVPDAEQEDEFRPDLNVRLLCPDCRTPVPNLVEEYSSGDIVCGDCGLVLGDRIVDTRSEWRTFANDEGDDPSRVGGPTNPLLDGGDQLSTIISFRDGNTGAARDLQRAQARGAAKTGEKNQSAAFQEITNKCEMIQLGRQEIETAKQVYKRVDDLKLLKGKPVDAIQAACIFIACRKGGVPRSFKEVVNLTRVKKKLIGQCYKEVERKLQLHESSEAAYKAASPEELMPRYCSALGDKYLEMYAKGVAKLCKETGVLAGRSPISVAGACIYFASHLIGRPQTYQDISSVTSVSEVTVKTSYKILAGAKEQVVEKEWLQPGNRWECKLDRIPNP